MRNEWKEIRLGDYITDIAAGPFGSNLKVECFVQSGFPIVDGANLKGYKVTDNITKFVTEEKAHSLARSIAKRNDIIVTISGNVGQIAYVPNDSAYEEYLCSQRQFRASIDQTTIDVRYLVYYFHSKEGQSKILMFANQVGVPALAQPLKNFREIRLSLPPLETQKKIAAVLGALDDKIELNRKMNENLEAQAQALFKSWFVDFTPFGGKMPKDWKKGVLADIAEINPARLLKKGEAATCIEMADLSTSTAFPNDWGVKTFNGGMKFKNGDTIMARITPCLENGKAAFVNCLAEGEVAFGSTEYITICSKGMAPNEMFYSLVRDADFISYATKHMNGSSGRQRVAGVDIAAYPFVIADDGTYAKISPILKCVFENIRVNSLESRKLAELRDTLLPKLMKGEIIV